MAEEHLATPPSLRVIPAADAPFDHARAVFGTRGDPAGCWCQWYKIPNADWRDVGREALEGRLEAQLADPAPGPGILAYAGDEPVGWCAVEPRPNLSRLRRGRIVRSGSSRPDLDDETVWAVSCFVVPREHRGRGVATELARGAIEFARTGGATVVEAYAVDPSARASVSAAELFHGTVSMFAAAGFTEVARPTASRVVMQVALRE